jgi:hypothetical protein
MLRRSPSHPPAQSRSRSSHSSGSDALTRIPQRFSSGPDSAPSLQSIGPPRVRRPCCRIRRTAPSPGEDDFAPAALTVRSRTPAAPYPLELPFAPVRSGWQRPVHLEDNEVLRGSKLAQIGVTNECRSRPMRAPATTSNITHSSSRSNRSRRCLRLVGSIGTGAA